MLAATAPKPAPRSAGKVTNVPPPAIALTAPATRPAAATSMTFPTFTCWSPERTHASADDPSIGRWIGCTLGGDKQHPCSRRQPDLGRGLGTGQHDQSGESCRT